MHSVEQVSTAISGLCVWFKSQSPFVSLNPVLICNCHHWHHIIKNVPRAWIYTHFNTLKNATNLVYGIMCLCWKMLAYVYLFTCISVCGVRALQEHSQCFHYQPGQLLLLLCYRVVFTVDYRERDSRD